MTQTMTEQFKKLGLAAALALAVAAPVGAADINTGLTPGVVNTIEDQDREAFIDNGDGVLGVGDVFIGFVRVDDFGPSGAGSGNSVYGVISNQITAVDGTGLIFSLGVTTTMGLRLEDLTGDANTTGGMFAIYDGIAPLNLISALPPDVAGALGVVDMFDYIDYITGGDLRLVAGITSPGDFLTVTNISAYPAGTPTAAFPSLSTTLTTGSFVGGMDLLYNNTNFIFDPTIQAFDPLTGTLQYVQVGIGSGAVRGATGATNAANFINAPGQIQCTSANGANVPCGFTTDADFFVAPRLPEPGSLALLGAALLAGFAVRRGVKKA